MTSSCGPASQSTNSDSKVPNQPVQKILLPIGPDGKVDPYGMFRWKDSSDAGLYFVGVSKSPDEPAILTDEVSRTAARVPGLRPNTSYYMSVSSISSGTSFLLADNSFTTGTGLAHLTTPVNRAHEVDPDVVFAWNGVIDAEMYYLKLSTVAPGQADAYDSGELPNITSFAHPDLLPNTEHYYRTHSFPLPVLQPNTKYYATLITKKHGSLYAVSSTFTTGYGKAHLTSPETTDGAGGVGPAPKFAWNSVPDSNPSTVGGTHYILQIGMSPGQSDVFNGQPTTENELTLPEGVLQANTSYYVRLWTITSRGIEHSDSAFSTGSFSETTPSHAKILFPVNNATSVDPFAPIVWSTVPNATYSIFIGDGSEYGINDRNTAWAGPTSHTSWLGGLIGEKTYTATLWTWVTSPAPCTADNPCQYRDIVTFTTVPLPMPHTDSAFYANVAQGTAAVRTMTDGHFVPRPATFLTNNRYPENPTAYCPDYANNFVSQLQNLGLVARLRDSIFGVGPLTHTVAEYYNPIRGAWEAADPMFAIIYHNDDNNPVGMDLNEIADAVDQGTARSIPLQFVTSSSDTPDCPQCFGSYWAENVLADPILLYLNPVDWEKGPATTRDAAKFLTEQTDAVGRSGVYIFGFSSPTDSVTIQNGSSQVVVGPNPSDVSWAGNYSTNYLLQEGWAFVMPPPAGLKVFALKCQLFFGPYCE